MSTIILQWRQNDTLRHVVSYDKETQRQIDACARERTQGQSVTLYTSPYSSGILTDDQLKINTIKNLK